jgi:hypothetical protein
VARGGAFVDEAMMARGCGFHHRGIITQLRCGRRSREARTGFMLPRSPSARDRGHPADARGRLAWVSYFPGSPAAADEGPRSRRTRLGRVSTIGCMLPTHRTMRLCDGWGTRLTEPPRSKESRLDVPSFTLQAAPRNSSRNGDGDRVRPNDRGGAFLILHKGLRT